MPLVSIITPAWNAEDVLAETIRSVQAQTVADWEMLVADDCSSDGTCRLVEQFSRDDARVKLIRRTQNGGPALTRQSALDAASGRYIAFLDSDDLWLPQKLDRQLHFMAEHPTALSYTCFRRISDDGATVGRLIEVPNSLTYRQLLCNTAIATLTAMVDREVAGEIRMTNEGYDDFCLWLSILKRGHVARGLREDLARYRVRGNSVSSKRMRSAGWVWNIYRNVEGLSLPSAAWCLANFGVRAYAKRLQF
ncbi:MAG: glycosyltransferase family 2 protein [Hyphomicrobiaceae bacterium]